MIIRIAAAKGIAAISHFLYANDILLFCRGSLNNIKKVVKILYLYGNMANQHVNWEKSHIFFGSSILASRRMQLVQEVDIRYSVIPFKYLGLPLFKDKPKVSHLKPMADKMLSHFDS